jgi:hypothetical protein
MNTTIFNSTNVEKLNEMLDTQVFNWMLAKEEMMNEKGVCEQNTSCPSTGIIGIAAEMENVTPSELIAMKVRDMFKGEYEIKAYAPTANEKNNTVTYPVRIKISGNKVINHNGVTYIYYKNNRELANIGSAIKICSIDKDKVDLALRFIDFLKPETLCCTYDRLAEQVAEYVSVMQL